MADALFIGTFPGGISYADRTRESAGDYLRLAFLPFGTLALEWSKARIAPAMRKAISDHAAGLQARRGERYEISTCGQTVILGGAPAMPRISHSAISPQLTVNQLKAWATENHDLAVTCLKAKAFATVERERVDAYILPIFLRYGFTSARTGQAITEPRKLYLSDDDALCTAYYAECDEAHRAHGYKGEAGTCPALVAEDLQRMAENVLLDSLAKFIGVDGFYFSLEIRAKALDLAFGTCLAKEYA